MLGFGFFESDAFAVDFHLILLRIDQNRQRHACHAVHRHAPLQNHLFHISPRRDASIAQHFLNTFFHTISSPRKGSRKENRPRRKQSTKKKFLSFHSWPVMFFVKKFSALSA